MINYFLLQLLPFLLQSVILHIFRNKKKYPHSYLGYAIVGYVMTLFAEKSFVVTLTQESITKTACRFAEDLRT